MSDKIKQDRAISVGEKIFLSVAIIIIVMVLATLIITQGKSTEHTYEVDTEEITVDYSDAEKFFLRDFEQGYPDYQIYDSGDLTAEILENRNGKVIVERCVGIVTDSETGDGMILNTDPDHYYISYAGVDGVTDGTVIVSYMVYSTKNNSIDDIEERYDYIASREYEQEVWM